jgi:hypothetical protein
VKKPDFSGIRTRTEAPVCLYSPITLAGTHTTGSTAGPALDSLTAPLDVPMVIDEIDWGIDLGGAGFAACEPGAFVQAEFNLGHLRLSEFPIPIWNYCPTYDPLTEIPDVSSASDPGGHGVPLGNSEGWVAWYRWVLPKPLYLGAGQVLSPQYTLVEIAQQTLLPVNGVTVHTAYRGRVVSGPPPKFIDVPFVSQFQCSAMNSFTGNANVVYSTERTLRNQFTVPLDLQRIIMRCYPFPSFNLTVEPVPQSTYPENFSIRLEDSGGYKLANQVNYEMIVDQRCAWTIGPSQLAPKGSLILSENTIGAQAAHMGLGNLLRQYSIVGSRRERYTE